MVEERQSYGERAQTVATGLSRSRIMTRYFTGRVLIDREPDSPAPPGGEKSPLDLYVNYCPELTPAGIRVFEHISYCPPFVFGLGDKGRRRVEGAKDIVIINKNHQQGIGSITVIGPEGRIY